MLKEEQVAELLLQCEKTLSKTLAQIRGNLKVAEARAAATWELLVIEAATKLGNIEYEPRFPSASPDILLHLPTGRYLWIEAAFLYPRFWKEERQENDVKKWLYKEGEKWGIPAWKICPNFYSDQNNAAGAVFKLPEQHEKKHFLKKEELVRFFKSIVDKPDVECSCILSPYTISIQYLPNASGPFLSSRGMSQKSPMVVEEHALYRVLKNKSKQFKVDAPLVICIGSDQSPVLSNLSTPGQVRIPQVIASAFRESSSLSAVIVGEMRDVSGIFELFPNIKTRVSIYLNPDARHPLTHEEMQLLSSVNLNRWKYTHALSKWGVSDSKWRQRVSGSLTWRFANGAYEIGFPSYLLIDALAGKSNVMQEYKSNDPANLLASLQNRKIKSFSLMAGNVAAAKPNNVILNFTPFLIEEGYIPVNKIIWRPLDVGGEIEISVNTLLEALTGKTNLIKYPKLIESEEGRRALSEGWNVNNCYIKDECVLAQRAPFVVLTLMPPPPSIFWSKKKDGK